MSGASWVEHVVPELPERLTGAAVVVLDPRGLLACDAFSGWEYHRAPSAWELRRVYERHCRRRDPAAPPVLIHCTAVEIGHREQLPWDISQMRMAAVDPRIAADVIVALPDLPIDIVAQVCDAARSNSPVGPLIAARMLGLALPAPDDATELLAAARAHSTGLAATVRAVIESHLSSVEARDAMGRPQHDGPLRAAWDDWCAKGARSKHHSVFSGCGPALLSLVDAGLLPPPAELGGGAPSWLMAASAIADPTPVVRALLDNAPAHMPADFNGWVELASWWARVRWACATDRAQRAVVDLAWQTWDSFDSGFREWLTGNYGTELSRPYLSPRTVDKIAPFLAYRLRRRNRPQALVVMDGMGLAQWHQLRAAADAVEAERHVVMAALPTITRVSRQAIFAGAPPATFADTIRSPAEERLWRRFWAKQGVDPADVVYASAEEFPKRIPPTARVVGIVVNDIDEAVHASGRYHDIALRDRVTRIANAGLLKRLVGSAKDRGWDLWFTSDHGNLAAVGLRRRIPHQGERVRTRGKRVWTYASETLRARADVPGLAWDPPGYPADAGYPLFAVGRSCYERNAVLVSHGGLSFDEVFVPLVRVET